MSNFRLGIGASLVCLAVILATASFTHAKPKRTSTPAEAACNVALSKCWDFCSGTKDSSTAEKCDANCMTKWNRCMDKAGLARTDPPQRPVHSTTKPPVDRGRASRASETRPAAPASAVTGTIVPQGKTYIQLDARKKEVARYTAGQTMARNCVKISCPPEWSNKEAVCWQCEPLPEKPKTDAVLQR